MLSLLKNLGASWEQSRDGLYKDLELIEVVLNRKWGATFGTSSILSPSSGGTGVSSLIAHGVIVGEGTSPVVGVLGGTNTVLHGNTGADPSFSAVIEADIALSNVTTNNVTIAKHGFVPTLPNDATKFFNGVGGYSVPPGSGSSSTPGPPGYDGLDGEDGFIALQGPQGNPGSAGATGAAGPMGPPGFSIDGEDGDFVPGIPGPVGATGSTGSTGSTGPTGPVGPPGFALDGNDGDFFPIPGPVGPQGPAGAGGSGAISSVTVTLTDSQYKSLNTVPVQVLAAQGAGITIVPIYWTLGANITTGFSANPTLNLQYTGGSGTNLTGQVITSTGISRRLANCGFVPTNNVVDTGKTNTAVEVFSNTNVTTGVTSGGFSFTMFYTLTTTP